MAAKQSSGVGRLAFIDWTRGLAALIMLQGHTFNSFTRTDLRSGGPYMLSQFAGGLPPAIFLFLTGITFSFLMDSQERKGGSARQKIWAALKRSRYLFLIAFLFRIQMFITGYPTSPASEIARVDILNCMGFAMLLFAPMAVFTTFERIKLCTALGVLVASLAPLVSMIDGSRVPWILHAYLFPDYNYFGFFPWASFLAFGMAFGSLLRSVKQEDMQRVMLWAFGIGLGVALLANYVSNLPYSIYPRSEYWLNSPALIVVKTGFVLCILSLAYVWVHLGKAQGWSIFRQLGTTSLIVYWVHIELVYGRWFGIWKEKMTVGGVVIYTLLLTALMALVSILQTRYQKTGTLFGNSRMPAPMAASGD